MSIIPDRNTMYAMLADGNYRRAAATPVSESPINRGDYQLLRNHFDPSESFDNVANSLREVEAYNRGASRLPEGFWDGQGYMEWFRGIKREDHARLHSFLESGLRLSEWSLKFTKAKGKFLTVHNTGNSAARGLGLAVAEALAKIDGYELDSGMKQLVIDRHFAAVRYLVEGTNYVIGSAGTSVLGYKVGIDSLASVIDASQDNESNGLDEFEGLMSANSTDEGYKQMLRVLLYLSCYKHQLQKQRTLPALPRTPEGVACALERYFDSYLLALGFSFDIDTGLKPDLAVLNSNPDFARVLIAFMRIKYNIPSSIAMAMVQGMDEIRFTRGGIGSFFSLIGGGRRGLSLKGEVVTNMLDECRFPLDRFDEVQDLQDGDINDFIPNAELSDSRNTSLFLLRLEVSGLLKKLSRDNFDMQFGRGRLNITVVSSQTRIHIYDENDNLVIAFMLIDIEGSLARVGSIVTEDQILYILSSLKSKLEQRNGVEVKLRRDHSQKPERLSRRPAAIQYPRRVRSSGEPSELPVVEDGEKASLSQNLMVLSQEGSQLINVSLAGERPIYLMDTMSEQDMQNLDKIIHLLDDEGIRSGSLNVKKIVSSDLFRAKLHSSGSWVRVILKLTKYNGNSAIVILGAGIRRASGNDSDYRRWLRSLRGRIVNLNRLIRQ